MAKRKFNFKKVQLTSCHLITIYHFHKGLKSAQTLAAYQ